MPKMKDTQSIFTGLVPINWKKVKLKYICDINKNTLNEKIDINKIINYIDISNVKNGEILNIEEYKFKDAPSRARRIVNKGDTIISTVRTYLRSIYYFEEINKENLICSTGFAVLTPKEKIFPTFVGYMISSDSFISEVVSKSYGVSYPAISQEELSNIICYIPPFEEQQRIANFLDDKTSKIDSLITTKEKQMELLNEYKQSLISETVTKGLNPDVKMKDSGVEWIGEIPEHWNVSKSKNYIDFIKGVSINESEMNHDKKGVRFLRTIDMYEKSKIKKEPLCFNGDTNGLPYKDKEDYLICFDGFNTKLGEGTIGLFSKKGEGLFSSHMYLIRNKNEKMLKKYAEYVVGSRTSLNQAIVNIKGAISFSCSHYKGNILITIPPLIEQKQIVEFLDDKTSQIDALIKNIQSEINKLIEYRHSLIFEAVTGKIHI